MPQKPLSEVKPDDIFFFSHNDQSEEYVLSSSIVPTAAAYKQGGNALLDAVLAFNRILEDRSLRLIISTNGAVKIAASTEIVEILK